MPAVVHRCAQTTPDAAVAFLTFSQVGFYLTYMFLLVLAYMFAVVCGRLRTLYGADFAAPRAAPDSHAVHPQRHPTAPRCTAWLQQPHYLQTTPSRLFNNA